MMPKGVEHVKHMSVYNAEAVVRIPMMPKGVEHMLSKRRSLDSFGV